MSRPQKTGLGYFPLDVDIFEDDKLFDIQNNFGCLGEVIYLRLLCLIYKNGYFYKFDNLDKLCAMLIKSIGNKWIGNKSTVKNVICELGNAHLFDIELLQVNVITSKSIQRRYLKASERRQDICNKEYWLLDYGELKVCTLNNVINDNNNQINVCNNSINVCNNAIKEKEIISKNSTIDENASNHLQLTNLLKVIPNLEIDCKLLDSIDYDTLATKISESDYLINFKSLSMLHKLYGKILSNKYKRFNYVIKQPQSSQDFGNERNYSKSDMEAIFGDISSEDNFDF